jgi:predicted TIM-barrel fold metal-dependent hydrolase
MIIDCHTHLGRNDHIRARVAELLKSMDEAKIDKSFVFAGSLNAYDNETMLEEIKPYRDRLYAVAAWDFEYRYKNRDADMFAQEEQIVRLYQSGEIVAVKFYTGYYHKMPSECAEILWRLNEIGCPAIFHCGDCLNSVKCAKLKYAHPLNIDDVAVDYPKMNFIIAHMGYPWHRDAAEVCYKNSNVYSDISGFVYGKFSSDDYSKFVKTLDEFTDIASSEKLLFGSDWPISNQSSYVSTLTSILGPYKAKPLMDDNIKKAFKL